MTYQGRTLGGRGGKVPLGVLVFGAVIAIIVVIAMISAGNRGTAVTGSAADSSAPALEDMVPESPFTSVANQLLQLIDSAVMVSESLAELTPDLPTLEAQRTRDEWGAMTQLMGARLDEIEALLPEPPAEDAETALQRGYARLPRAIEALRELVQESSQGAVPGKVARDRQLGIARNHVASAQRYFFRIGL